MKTLNTSHPNGFLLKSILASPVNIFVATTTQIGVLKHKYSVHPDREKI